MLVRKIVVVGELHLRIVAGRREAVLPEGLEEAVRQVVVRGRVLHLIGLRRLREDARRESQHRVGIHRVGGREARRERAVHQRRIVDVAEQQMTVQAVRMHRLIGRSGYGRRGTRKADERIGG